MAHTQLSCQQVPLRWLSNAISKAGKYFSPEIYRLFSSLKTFLVNSSALSSWIPADARGCCPEQKRSHSSGTVKWANSQRSASFDWDVIFIALCPDSFLLFPLIKCLFSLALLTQEVLATRSTPRRKFICRSDSRGLIQMPKHIALSCLPSLVIAAELRRLQFTPPVGSGEALWFNNSLFTMRNTAGTPATAR